MTPSYWLDLFTFETWKEFLAAGASVSGFRESRWKAVQRLKPGDILLCYLTGVGRWIGVLEIVGPAFKDNAPIWKLNDFPARVPVKLICKLDPLHGVPILEMREKLSIFQNLKTPYAWTGHLRGSPQKWNQNDGEAIIAAVKYAESHPVERPFDPAKLRKVPPILKTAKGALVTIPDDTDDQTDADVAEKIEGASPVVAVEGEGTSHNEIQWLLLKLGGDIGLDVWVAKNDKGKSFKGIPFSSAKRLKETLPLQFDEATTRTIQLIDVLWLKGNSIQAAFEIESTTSIFSGLLRMSDLITMQPNLKIPLYIVAPSERRNKVITEVNRPTFARLSPPMAEMCRFISFEELRKQLQVAEKLVQFLKPEFLDSFSESCAIEDA
jgi:hypothetical protein